MKAPNADQVVMTCGTCNHWQLDVHPRAVQQFAGNRAATYAAVEAHAEHVTSGECPGAGGRIKVHGQWVEPPPMPDGGRPGGVLVGQRLPRWWVWR